ncbi:uncharacterized protein LOC144302688 [Canis aureus]
MAHRGSTSQHTGVFPTPHTGETANATDRGDLGAHSQRPACLPHADIAAGRQSASRRRPARSLGRGPAAPRRGPVSRSQVAHCMLGLVVSPVILPVTPAPAGANSCFVHRGSRPAEVSRAGRITPCQLTYPKGSRDPPGFCLPRPTVAEFPGYPHLALQDAAQRSKPVGSTGHAHHRRKEVEEDFRSMQQAAATAFLLQICPAFPSFKGTLQSLWAGPWTGTY